MRVGRLNWDQGYPLRQVREALVLVYAQALLVRQPQFLEFQEKMIVEILLESSPCVCGDRNPLGRGNAQTEGQSCRIGEEAYLRLRHQMTYIRCLASARLQRTPGCNWQLHANLRAFSRLIELYIMRHFPEVREEQ